MHSFRDKGLSASQSDDQFQKTGRGDQAAFRASLAAHHLHRCVIAGLHGGTKPLNHLHFESYFLARRRDATVKWRCGRSRSRASFLAKQRTSAGFNGHKFVEPALVKQLLPAVSLNILLPKSCAELFKRIGAIFRRQFIKVNLHILQRILVFRAPMIPRLRATNRLSEPEKINRETYDGDSCGDHSPASSQLPSAETDCRNNNYYQQSSRT